MIRSVPSVCIATHDIDSGSDMIIDLLHRGVPVLLLDARERWPLIDYETMPTTTLAKKTKSLLDPRVKLAQKLERQSSSSLPGDETR